MDDDRDLDEGQDPAERCADDGCEDDGLGRCMICDRRMPPVASLHPFPARGPARERLARTRARSRERRALMRGRREVLREAPMMRARGIDVPRAVDLVRMVEAGTTWNERMSASIPDLGFFLGMPDAHITNESGCLHCDGSGPDDDSDRQLCGHGHALDF